MKILLVGEIFPGGAVHLIFQNLQTSGVEVELINISGFFKVSFLNRILNKFQKTPRYFGSGLKKLNRFVLAKAAENNFDFILFFKPIFFSSDTIKKLKENSKIISWYPDHVNFPKSGSADFYKSIPLYDLHLSCIRSNAETLLKYGAKKSLYLMITADPSLHHPIPVTDEEKKKLGCDVVFVGTHAPEKRVEYLEKLAKKNYNLLIYGNSWRNLPIFSPLRRKNIIKPPAYGDNMSKVMSASKIVLAFMREHNDEKIGCRTYEIPLCGTFMLHERNPEAEALFIAGKEADFFDSYEEMKEKIDFYLARPELRAEIAKAGYEKILRSGELIADQAKKLVEILKQEF